MISKIINAIKKVLPAGIEAEIVASEKEDFGHYSTNVAFKLAPTSKASSGLARSPLEIAKDLAQKLSGPSAGSLAGQAGSIFAKIEAMAPGFVNLWLAPEVLQKEIGDILKEGKSFGRLRIRFPRKINVEFVSANPTGPLTMANGRGGFLGDVLANVLEKSGHKVTREFYVNDAGNQIKLLGESILAAEGKIPPKDEYYKGNYIKKLKGKTGKQAVAILLREIKSSLAKVDIKYDVWFSEEQKLRKTGEVKKVLEFLKQKGLTEEKDNAIWLKGADIVLIKSDKNPTYFLVDLAYHLDKLAKRKFDLAIDIWGADHHGAAARLQNGIKLLGIGQEKLKIILTQLVRLVSKGKEVKMSKRAGEFITMDELIKEVGADVARFFFLMHSPDTHMDFDLDLAKERSQKNPVFYVQYAYVRCQSILRKSQITNPKSQLRNVNLLNSESEIKLMLELLKFPDILAEVSENYQVHRLTKYAVELAQAFHNFYEKERVVGVEKNLMQARLALVSAAKITLENLFDILGISKPNKM